MWGPTGPRDRKREVVHPALPKDEPPENSWQDRRPPPEGAPFRKSVMCAITPKGSHERSSIAPIEGQAAGGEERATGAEDHRPHAP